MAIRMKIEKLADRVVNKYIEDGCALDRGIADVVGAEGFKDEHIKRLVEAANKKTFLKLYPDKHEFEVASTGGVKEMLNNTPVKNAVEVETGFKPVSTTELLNYKLLDLCGNGTLGKQAGEKPETHHSPRGLRLLRGQVKKALEELGQEARLKRAEILDAKNNLAGMSRHVMLRGASFRDLETYVLSTTENVKAAEVMDMVFERVEELIGRYRDGSLLTKNAFERGGRISPFVGRSNYYVEMVERIIKTAYEELPVVERAADLLREKLAEIEEALRGLD